MKDLTSVFLSQSYADTWDDYVRSLKGGASVRWDYVVLTASDEHQAAGFRAQLEERRNAGFLPPRTRFAVIPDRDGKRIGSGGATLSVIRYIAAETGKTDFSGLRILCVHSGGDSKRVPQYSALGKLFSPVPHELPNGRISTLFDEFMVVMSTVASRIHEGMVILSGDVLLLFNPLQIDYSGNGAAAISFKEDVTTGKEHGVFLNGSDGNVAEFLHKQTVESLASRGAVNERNLVDIDTGAVIFSPDMLKSLYGLVPDDAAYDRYVNDRARLSLYGDFLYPLAERSSLERFYSEKPEGEPCPELASARTEVWKALRPFRIKLLRLAPAKFIHFGTTKEILELVNRDIASYKDLGWSNHVGSSINGKTAGYNSILSDGAKIGADCYLEASYVHSGAVIGDNVLLSYVDVHDETIPSDVVVHSLKTRDGRFVTRIFGTDDNPKTDRLFGKSLDEFMGMNGISASELWGDDTRVLWTADIYPVCKDVRSAMSAALNVYKMAHGEGNAEEWRSSDRTSLRTGFNDADNDALIAWETRMRELVRMDGIAKLILNGKPASGAKSTLGSAKLTKIQKKWLSGRLERYGRMDAMRLLYYTGTALGEAEGSAYIAESFKTIQSAVLESAQSGLDYNEDCIIRNDKTSVKLPLRVNFGGGWSDTPPYCIEHGGTVLNAAITLNGEKPVEVTLEKIPEHRIVFDSRDMDVHGEFESIAPLQATGDPYDSFALQKAALLACGIIPASGGSLDVILTRLGGGFIMRSEVTGVPKGSGLGTSSILAAACVKAIFDFMGIEYTEDSLYTHVLAMEQIMSTGGGWQDQVGGVTDGIKYITSAPGITQRLRVDHVELSPEVKNELNGRFCLIYTGQRRLARNLLRDVVGRYVGNEPDSLYALNEIQRVAALMRFELERGNIDAFAKLLDYHWELSKKIDAGSTNTLIDQIFASIDDLIDGKLVCGAGGGGFLQVILKKGVKKEDAHVRLKEVFQDSAVDVWRCELV